MRALFCVGMVAATDLRTARRAAGLVEVEYEPLPPVFSYDEAMAAGAPLVHEHLGSNLAVTDSFEWGDVEAGMVTPPRPRVRWELLRFWEWPARRRRARAAQEAAA